MVLDKQEFEQNGLLELKALCELSSFNPRIKNHPFCNDKSYLSRYVLFEPLMEKFKAVVVEKWDLEILDVNIDNI